MSFYKNLKKNYIFKNVHILIKMSAFRCMDHPVCIIYFIFIYTFSFNNNIIILGAAACTRLFLHTSHNFPTASLRRRRYQLCKAIRWLCRALFVLLLFCVFRFYRLSSLRRCIVCIRRGTLLCGYAMCLQFCSHEYVYTKCTIILLLLCCIPHFHPPRVKSV